MRSGLTLLVTQRCSERRCSGEPEELDWQAERGGRGAAPAGVLGGRGHTQEQQGGLNDTQPQVNDKQEEAFLPGLDGSAESLALSRASVNVDLNKYGRHLLFMECTVSSHTGWR